MDCGAGCGFAAGGAAGAVGRDDDEPPPCRDAWLEIWFPAGDTTNQAAPKAVPALPVDVTGLVVLDEQRVRYHVAESVEDDARAKG
ncbi:MAG TPA: hypothetical protein VN880_05245 [Solirubrobacteraceae bacterium]|nr:hypothetical protein [Solirubrobacteraceae bacterium]